MFKRSKKTIKLNYIYFSKHYRTFDFELKRAGTREATVVRRHVDDGVATMPEDTP